MRITIEKKHEGKTVYGLGWGNNCPRGGRPNTPIEFKVVKVNRKYARLIHESSRREVGYHPESGATQECINSGYGNNSGYQFFESLEDIENHNELERLKGNISSFFRQHNPKLTEGQARTIHAILFPNAVNQTAE
jgi:hypothetical protein